jgi:hypothetical protein
MPTMDEAAKALGLCEFCSARSSLLCDGKLPDGRTCDKRICRAHARMVAHVSLQTKGGRRCDTRDLCPDCIAAGREAR